MRVLITRLAYPTPRNVTLRTNEILLSNEKEGKNDSSKNKHESHEQKKPGTKEYTLL